MDLESISIKSVWDTGGKATWDQCMGFSGGILGQSMGLVRMIIREKEWINYKRLFGRLRIIQRIGG